MSIVNTIPYRDLMIVHVTGATATTVIFNAESPRLRVLDAWCRQRAAGESSDTISIDNGTTAITDLMVVDNTKGEKILTRALSVDDGTATLEKGGTLRAVWNVGNSDADVFILCQLLH